jgi:S-adenosylmethionine synthetase
MVDTHGTGTIHDGQIEDAVASVFDLTPGGIISALELRRPVYYDTAAYGHFGREEFTWEKTDRADELLHACGVKTELRGGNNG